ncbi:MAG TPA: outer membrane protein assembly factor BamD [Polyangiaceae bacterium]|nr:outer membrane protein assembly factor BamD [Polyangiaceae bacterium]
MTDRAARDLLKDLRAPVVPVEVPEVVASRRARTIARLESLQRRELANGVTRRSRRKWMALAAIVLLPAAVLAATNVASRTSAPPPAARAELAPAAEAPPVAAHPAPVEPASPPTAFADVAPLPAAVPSQTTGQARHASPAPARNPSTLAEENALMQRALGAVRRGEDARAAALLDDFLARYPGSPLAQNAEVERYRVQYRSGNVARARQLASTYLDSHPTGMAKDEASRLVGEDRSSASLP